MADLGMDLDHESVEESKFTPIPAGTYLAQIKSSEAGPTKSGAGRMAKFTWEILEGPCEGRLVFDQVNYQHSNPTAQLIGQQHMKAICEAVGHRGPIRDTADLEFRPVFIRVGIEEDKSGQYGPKNVIKGVKPRDVGQPPAAPQGGPSTSRATHSGGTSSTPQSPPPRAPAGAGGAAWRRPA